jgi:hypothetical protein
MVYAIVAASSSVTAVTEDENDTTDVNVTVLSDIAVDVKPEELDYIDTKVGDFNGTSNQSFTAVEIENTGSEYINRIWLNTTEPSSDPFGTGSAANYDAANFMYVRPNNDSGLLAGDDENFLPANRKEFMETNNNTDADSEDSLDVPSYISAPAGSPYTLRGGQSFSSADFVEVGRVTFGDEWFFFAVPNDNDCDGTGNEFVRFGNTSHTPDTFGTVDFQDNPNDGDPADYEDHNLTVLSNSDYGLTQSGLQGGNGIDVSGLDTDQDGDSDSVDFDLAVWCGHGNSGSQSAAVQPHAYVLRYNPTAVGASDLSSEAGSATTFLIDASNTDNMLAPGGRVTVDTGVHIPLGVPEGTVSNGKLRVFVTADTSADTS